VQEIGRDRHARKHAHVATPGVADGNAADRRAEGAKNDANDLAYRRDALVTANRKLEHEPMRENMPPNRCLAEHVSAFEMNAGAVQVAASHQLSPDHDFVLEHFLMRRVHGNVVCNSGASSGPAEIKARHPKSGGNRAAAGHMAADSRPSSRVPVRKRPYRSCNESWPTTPAESYVFGLVQRK